MIAFNDRKDRNDIEISELEFFINNQYKKNRDSKEAHEAND